MTPLFAALQARYPDLTGSEFDQPQRRGGETFRVGEIEVRHEDLTDLSFASASFDHLLSFDVLEHVPDYQAAIGEMARVLKPDGHLLLTAPFDLARAQTLVRASLADNGQLVHHETPEYHGDPVRSDAGILCFYHFGWDLLDRLRGAGFQQVSLLLAWDPARAYLGWGQSLILARR